MAISVGSVSVDVTPNTRSFATDLKAKLKGVTANIAVTADTARLRETLDRATTGRTAVIRAKADTGAATAALDVAARDRTATIRAESSGVSGATRGVSGLVLAVAALGPALVPVVATVAGLGAALVAPLAVVGGGLTIGAIIAGAAIADTKKQQKNITELAKKVQSAKLAVETAATPAGKKSAMIREAAAVDSYRRALAQLSPAQKKFLAAQGTLKQSFRGLLTSAGGAVFGPLIKGMNLLAKVLPNLKPLLAGVAGGINTLLGDLGKAASGPGFKTFMNAFGASASALIVTFGRTFGNFAKGLFGLFKAFTPLSKDFTGGLSNMSKSFADWGTNVGKSKGFQNFLAYVRDVGPKVAGAIGSMVKALVRIGIALAPLGALALGAIKVLADTVNTIPVPVLTATAGAIVAIVVALKAAQIINNGSRALGTLSTTINGFRGADSQLSKTQTAIRGLAGAGGIGLLTTAATTSNKKLGILAATGGGALLGFAVGGPVGAAIGAGAGALFGLAKQADKGHKAIKVSLPSWKDYATTLDGVAASATKATRAMALQRLEKSGLLDSTRKLGLTDRQAVDAIQGDPKQRKRLSDLLRNTNILTPEQEAALRKETGAVGSARLATLRQNVVIAANPKELFAARKALREFMAEPANKRLAITGVEDAKAQLRSLRKALRQTWGMTPNPKTAGPGGLGVLLNPGVEGAGARGAIINRPTVALIGENGPERLTPLDQTAGNSPLPASGGSSGAMFHIDKVVAQDVNDLLRQMQNRSRLAGLSGRRP